MSDSEHGISQVQIAAAQAQSSQSDGLQRHHKRNVAYLDERIFFFIVLLAIVGLLVVWLTAKSALVLYGSLGVVLLMLVLWGVVRINRINRIEKKRTLQVKAMQSESSE